MHRTLAALTVAALPALAAGAVTTWQIDPAHSASQFTVKHLVISTVRGQFGKTTGTIQIDDQDPSRDQVQATVDTTTVDTRVAARDADLKSPNFLDVAKYPTMTFRSTGVEPAGPDHLKVTGDLTIKGTTKPVTFDVTVSPPVKGMGGEVRRGFNGTAKIDRKQFGLNWNKMVEAGPVVGDEVNLVIDLEAVEQAPGAGQKAAQTQKSEQK